MGYISQQDYTHRKSTPSSFRFVVFGDSFTSGHFLEMPWPDRLQRLLNSRASANGENEVYSFAVNGGGLANWHSIFFKQVVNGFDFDGVIIASLADNLSRDFAIFHGTADGIYYGRFPQGPESREEFVERFLPRMARHYDVKEDSHLDALLQQRKQARFMPFDFYATRFFVREIRGYASGFMKRKQSTGPRRTLEELSESDDRMSMARLEKTYGQRKLSRLTEILDYCRQNNIPVILASVPSREGLLELFKTNYRKKTVHQVELSSIAYAYGTEYFDGYDLFRGIDPKQIVSFYWLKYDGHWALPGSDLFARGLAQYIGARLSAGRLRTARSLPQKGTAERGAT
jgi:hypothetical protein